ncbi:MAG: RHS repeat protein [Lachnospiraceae bacterium]|nr:RHS repeat protein [Lachnospiraceae bacterium]
MRGKHIGLISSVIAIGVGISGYTGLQVYASVMNISIINQESSQSIEYEYDELNRVIEVRYPDGTIVLYEYDKNGNIKKTTVIPSSEDTTTEHTGTEATTTEHTGTEATTTEHTGIEATTSEHTTTEYTTTEYASTEATTAEQTTTEHTGTKAVTIEHTTTEHSTTEYAGTEAMTAAATTEQTTTEHTGTEASTTEQISSETLFGPTDPSDNNQFISFTDSDSISMQNTNDDLSDRQASEEHTGNNWIPYVIGGAAVITGLIGYSAYRKKLSGKGSDKDE